ncbi:nuclease-like protein [Ornithinimicrobium humiphilum]|uniref:Nuclease-like protein n=2 Tax=Ornithinimicrobium humiphilum TaxID=125288 RepID=A0A543KLA9_9MICO|nr:nuclease-like protein [Ornithinimicrobium humiphilum]
MWDGADHLSSSNAGRGADEQARRAAARAERLRAQLETAERQQRAWAAGSEGERLVAAVIREACWPALHDQPWPGRPKANLDHLAISATRIWLIDAKHWSGEVVVRHGVLRQNGYKRTDNLAAARVAATDVAAALGPLAPLVTPVVCLTQAGRDLMPTMVDDVVVVGLDHLAATLGPAPTNYESMPALMAHVEGSLQQARPHSTNSGAPPLPAAAPPFAATPPPLPTYPAPAAYEQTRIPMQPRPAGGLRRATAAVVDLLVFVGVSRFLERLPYPSDDLAAMAYTWAGFLVLFVLALMHGTTGRTPGKALLGIRLVRERDGAAPGALAGVARLVTFPLLAVVTMGVFLLLSLLGPVWNRRGQSLHDLVMKTSVVVG